jgi:hypothetical protein
MKTDITEIKLATDSHKFSGITQIPNEAHYRYSLSLLADSKFAQIGAREICERKLMN